MSGGAQDKTLENTVQYSTGSSTIYYCILYCTNSSVVPAEGEVQKNNEVTKYMYVHYSIVVVEVWGYRGRVRTADLLGGIKISIAMPTNAVQLSHSGSRQYTVVAVVVHGSSLDGSSSGVVVYTVFTASFPLYLIIRFIYSSYPGIHSSIRSSSIHFSIHSSSSVETETPPGERVK